MSIMFIRGVSDDSQIGVTLSPEGKLGYLLKGVCWVYGQMSFGKTVTMAPWLFGERTRQKRVDVPQNLSLVFNEIAEPDTHRGALDRCSRLVGKLGVPVINHPDKIKRTTRDLVADRLHGIPGVVMPRTVRFQPLSPEQVIRHADAVNFELPCIARVAGDHNGKSMVLVTDPTDHSDLHALPFDGRDFYLTEYVDYQNDDGRFHKQRIVVIDGEPVLRHAIYGQEWNVHGSSRVLMQKEEGDKGHLDRVRKMESELLPKARAAIDEITKRLELEYYGIDCNIDHEGNLLIFEANANMNTLNNRYPELIGKLDSVKDKIRAMLSRHSGENVTA